MNDVPTRSPDGSKPPGDRPGRMTAVMRAVATSYSGPKVLRIAHLLGGRIVEERLMKERGAVTIGASEENTFVVAAQTRSSALFEIVNGEYHLALLEGLTGRVLLRSGPADLATLRGSARVCLDDESRGRLVVGESTFLFELVPPLPRQTKPHLPASVRGNLGENVDWAMTVIGALSFLLHFGAIGSFYSDWGDTIVDDQASVGGLVERIARLPPPPVEPPPQTPEETIAKTPTEERSPTKAPSPRTVENHSRESAPKAPESGKKPMSSEQAALAFRQLAAVESGMIGVLSGTKSATADVLLSGNVPAGDLESFAKDERGIGKSGPGGLILEGPGTGPMVPGVRGDLSNLGSKQGAEGTTKTSGTQANVAGPVAKIDGNSRVAVGKVSGAEAALAGARGRVRACYQSGLAGNGDMEGRVTFTVSLSGTGAVSGVSTSPSGSLSGGVVSCIQGVLRSVKFEAPEGGTGATLNGSYSFVNGNKGK